VTCLPATATSAETRVIRKQAPIAKLISCLVGTDQSFHLFLRGRNVVEMSPSPSFPPFPTLFLSVSLYLRPSLSLYPPHHQISHAPGPAPPPTPSSQQRRVPDSSGHATSVTSASLDVHTEHSVHTCAHILGLVHTFRASVHTTLGVVHTRF
jgi:hypothetical protein